MFFDDAYPFNLSQSNSSQRHAVSLAALNRNVCNAITMFCDSSFENFHELQIVNPYSMMLCRRPLSLTDGSLFTIMHYHIYRSIAPTVIPVVSLHTRNIITTLKNRHLRLSKHQITNISPIATKNESPRQLTKLIILSHWSVVTPRAVGCYRTIAYQIYIN